MSGSAQILASAHRIKKFADGNRYICATCTVSFEIEPMMIHRIGNLIVFNAEKRRGEGAERDVYLVFRFAGQAI